MKRWSLIINVSLFLISISMAYGSTDEFKVYGTLNEVDPLNLTLKVNGREYTVIENVKIKVDYQYPHQYIDLTQLGDYLGAFVELEGSHLTGSVQEIEIKTPASDTGGQGPNTGCPAPSLPTSTLDIKVADDVVSPGDFLDVYLHAWSAEPLDGDLYFYVVYPDGTVAYLDPSGSFLPQSQPFASQLGKYEFELGIWHTPGEGLPLKPTLSPRLKSPGAVNWGLESGRYELHLELRRDGQKVAEDVEDLYLY